MKENKKSWIRRHPVLTVIGILLLLSFILSPFLPEENSVSNKNKKSSNIDSDPEIVSIGEKGILSLEDDKEIMVATSKENYDAMVDASIAHDEIGFKNLYFQGKTYLLSSGTQVLVLDQDWTATKIRVLEGSHYGESAWTNYEWIIPEKINLNN
jgi:hypothetical protein